MLTKFIENMDIISALDDEPNDVGGLTAEEVKAEFDKGGKLLKDYINGTLTEEMDAHINSKENPHSVTKKQVGLGNCDNTADTEKPVSTAQQTALDLKSDKSNVLEKNNTTEYTPTADYNPATKKYVDKTTANVVLGQIPDGTITNEKLASSLRGNQPNGINWLDENGDVPVEQLDNVKIIHNNLTANERTWEKIQEITLEQDTAQLDISVSSDYTEFRIVSRKIANTLTNQSLYLNFNNNTTNIYNYSYVYDSSFSHVNNQTHIEIGKYFLSDLTHSALDLTIIKNINNTFIHYNYLSAYGGSGQGVFDSSDSITSIQFIPNAGCIKTGSTFEIWGR